MEEVKERDLEPQTVAATPKTKHLSTKARVLIGAGLLAGSGLVWGGAAIGQAIARASTPRVPEVDRRSLVIEGALSTTGLPVPTQEDGHDIIRPGMADVRNKGAAIVWLCTDPTKGQISYDMRAVTSQPYDIQVIVDQSHRDNKDRILVPATFVLSLNTETEANAFVTYSEVACNF